MITVTAPAKVNLHLEVLGLRSDGFHELAMVMQSIELADRLSFQNTADAQLSLTCDDASLSVGDDNLILRAAQLLRDRSGFSELGASIHLEKRIPIGAGLAGGSSDGAAALVGLNVMWGLGHSPAALERMAAELGSDMPFCVAGGCQLCFGRGEQLEAVPPTPQPLAVLLVKDPHGERFNRPGPTSVAVSSINPTTSLTRRLLNNAGKPCAALIGSSRCAASCHLPCAMTCRRWLLLKQLRCVRRSIC